MSKLMRRVALLMMFLVAVALAACGGGGGSVSTGATAGPSPVTPTTPVHSQQFCSGLTDKCVPAGKAKPLNPLLASECKIPDVSNWQQHVNWAEAKSHVCGGIFKGGEALSVDAYASDNNSQLSSLHIWHAMYWFIRNVGCSAEADAIAREAHALHVAVVINDLESPSDNQGYGSCLPPLEKRAGLIPVDYTSPGTWSSGDGGFGAVPLWQAEYGPTLHALWRPVLLWQCTDGHFGCVTDIPGIGVDDVSVNLGITKLGATPPKPKDPFAVFPKTLYGFGYGIRAGEYGTVTRWHQFKCADPVKRQVCESLHYHAQLLRDRLAYVAKHDGGWGQFSRSTRYKALQVIVG